MNYLRLRILLCARKCLLNSVFFALSSSGLAVTLELYVGWLLLLRIWLGFVCLVAEQVLRFSIQILLGLLLVAPVTLLSSKEIVILAAAANPPSIWEVKLILRTVLFQPE